MNKNITTITVAITGFFIGVIFTGVFINHFASDFFIIEKNIQITENGISDSVEKLYDSVVVITSSLNGTMIGSGTGFIYKKEGNEVYIITNNHVVSDGDSVTAIFNDGEELDGIVMGGDVFDDIAVIKLITNKDVQIATMGNSEELRLGDTLFTVGAPVTTEYSGTVTRGIVSGLDRLVSISIGSSGTDWIMKVIQTDAAINPGNSGGPLANINGEVIGVNTLKLVDEDIEGIGFAIPIESVMKSAEVLEQGLTIIRPYFGVSLYDVTDIYQLLSINIKLDSSIEYGAVIGLIVEGSTADKLGITPGTVMVKVNDEKVTNKAEFRYELYNYEVGDEVTFTYIQNGEIIEKTIVLESE